MTVMMGEKGEEYSKKSQNISMNDRVPLPLPLPVVKSTMQGIGFFSIGSGYKIEIYHMKPNPVNPNLEPGQPVLWER